MIRMAVALALLGTLGAPRAAWAEAPRWLVVAASATTLDKPLGAVVALRSRFAGAEVVASADCANMAPGRFLATLVKPAEQSVAEAARRRAAAAGTKAIVQACRIRPDGRIALGLPLIDPSVEKLPADAVNWTDGDRISDAVRLPDGVLWLRRTRVDDPDDPREGRRTAALYLPRTTKTSVPISADCTDAFVAATAGRLALACAGGTAGDVLLHDTVVFDLDSGRQIVRVPRCRAPAFAPGGLSCRSETVSPEGHLRLESRPIVLP